MRSFKHTHLEKISLQNQSETSRVRQLQPKVKHLWVLCKTMLNRVGREILKEMLERREELIKWMSLAV